MMLSASFVILFVVDDIILGESLQKLCLGYGHRIIVATNYIEAEDIYYHKQIDLLVVDHFPTDDPEKKALNKIHKTNRSLPLLLVAAQGTAYMEAIEAGATDYVEKPVVPAIFHHKISRILAECSSRYRLALLGDIDPISKTEDGNSFFIHFSRELERTYRQQHQLHLAMVYVADNDDDFIHSLGQILNDAVRTYVDHVCRCTRREFALILPETTADQAVQIVQRIFVSNLEQNEGKPIISMGCISCNYSPDQEKDLQIERCIRRVRGAMEESRNEGGNSVVFYEN